MEVVSPHAQVVSEWFRGKVDFPVNPPRLQRRSDLLGGRLGHLDGSDAALLIYSVSGAKVSVMIFDPQRAPLPELERGGAVLDVHMARAGGYNVALTERDGVAYSFTSELAPVELSAFVTRALSR